MSYCNVVDCSDNTMSYNVPKRTPKNTRSSPAPELVQNLKYVVKNRNLIVVACYGVANTQKNKCKLYSIRWLIGGD